MGDRGTPATEDGSPRARRPVIWECGRSLPLCDPWNKTTHSPTYFHF